MTKFVVKCFFHECVGPHTEFFFDTLEEAEECEHHEWLSSANWDDVTLEEVENTP